MHYFHIYICIAININKNISTDNILSENLSIESALIILSDFILYMK